MSTDNSLPLHRPAGTPGTRPATQTEVAALLDGQLDDIRPDAARRILIAALTAFARSGYAGTTTRDIAGLAGMSPAALYVHFRSKEEVLFRVSLLGHQVSRGRLDRALAAPAGTATERLAVVVASTATGHARNQIVARVVQHELWALTPEHYAVVADVRRGIERDLRAVIVDGVAAGEFDTPDPGGAALAILSLSIDLGRWYRPDGPRTPEEIGRAYAAIALRIVGARPPDLTAS